MKKILFSVFYCSMILFAHKPSWENFKNFLLEQLDPNNNNAMYTLDILLQERCDRIRLLVSKSREEKDSYSIMRVAEETGLFAVCGMLMQYQAQKKAL